ncbi:unnamed protein product [Mytilus coruscus]|uniref:Retrotransposon gag domain-containing protein n=1 Tax=Mytilus coruscus TaxID=42192 RepID=A0A6J8CSY3_MYTCO|nr:unnamed protein product [Mytilus coruscus]
MTGPSISNFHTIISSPSTRLNSQSYPTWGLHTNISTNSINVSTYSNPINNNVNLTRPMTADQTNIMTNLLLPRISSLSDSNLNRSTYHVNHKLDEVKELRRRIQELEREKEFNTRQIMTTEPHPSAHIMQSQYRYYGNGEQQPCRWNQQNSTYYPDTDLARRPIRCKIVHNHLQVMIPISQVFHILMVKETGKLSWYSSKLLLNDEALIFATELAQEVRISFMLFNSEIERRFGNYNFPETYKRELQTVKKQYKESIHEYAARIEGMIRLVETMEAEEEVDYEDLNCRKAVPQRFVTEERLNQFGRDMRESMTKDIIKSVGDMIDDKLMNKAPEKRGDIYNNTWLPGEKQQKPNSNR